MSDSNFQIAGLFGFIISGVVFFVSGAQSGDRLTSLGSLMWILACMIWLIPLVRRSGQS